MARLEEISGLLESFKDEGRDASNLQELTEYIQDFTCLTTESDIVDALAIINLPTFKARPVVHYCDLSEAWQAVADSNLDDLAEETLYLEPEETDDPEKHILWDMSECMRVASGEMDGVIGISNNSSMAVKLSDCGETAYTWILS